MILLGKRGKLKASTLTEMLVVMVISSIVLLVVMDGLVVFRYYTSRMVAKIGRNSDQISNYMLLEEMCLSSDSIKHNDSTLNLFCTGKLRWILANRDSTLCLGSDTLFTRALVLDLSADRLKLALYSSSDIADTVFFVIGRNENLCKLSEMEKNEKKYIYE